MKYKVGDLVRIKTWEQMVSEFGVKDRYIPCKCTFTDDMKYLCGTVHEISRVSPRDFYELVNESRWNISDDMIAGLAEDVPEEPAGHDPVNHPSHYCREDAMESIDEMLAVFGKDAVMGFCICNVWKYRYRAGDKNGQEDLKKSDWYMKKYLELKGEV